MTATALSAPVLTTVPRVELGAVGRWNISNIKGWEPTPDDFASAVAALGCPAVRRPVIKLGHSGQPGEGDPAIGYIDNMSITDDGQILVGDFAGIPAWLGAEDTNGQSVLASAYPDRSGEWEHQYVCQLGHTHPFVLHAMAILGVIRPGIGTLQSLHDLYTTPPEVAMATTLASTDGQVQSAATADDVRSAYYAGPGTNFNLYIREMYIDPAELIVQDDADGGLTRVSYTIAADGTVNFGTPEPVKVQYVTARAAAEQPLIAFASRAESRPEQRPSPPQPIESPAASAGGSTERSTAVAFTDEQITTLRQRLGVTDDADEVAILAALEEALAEQADPGKPGDPTPLPEGVATIDAHELDELRVAARAGQEARTQQQTELRERLVGAAVTDGRIPPARRDHWVRQLETDPGSSDVLASLAPGLIPVAAIGHGLEPDKSTDDALFEQLFGKVN